MHHFPITRDVLVSFHEALFDRGPQQPERIARQDVQVLRLLGKVTEQALYEAHKRTQARLALHRAPEEFGEYVYLHTGREIDGERLIGYYGSFVAIVHGGRDCDCVEVHNIVSLVPADWRSIEKFVDGLYDGAEGPVWWRFEKPSVAKRLDPPTSRDRVLEAFENGSTYNV